VSQKCRWCDRKAIFRAGGKKGKKFIHSDKEHDLCGRCLRDLENKLRHRRKGVEAEHPLESRRQVGPFLPLQVLLEQDQVRQREEHDHAVSVLDMVFGPDPGFLPAA
jgi:hypothetical protein